MKKTFVFIIITIFNFYFYAQNIKVIKENEAAVIAAEKKIDEISSELYTQFESEKKALVPIIKNSPFPESVLDEKGIPLESARLEREKEIYSEVEKIIEKISQALVSETKEYEDTKTVLLAQIENEKAAFGTSCMASSKDSSVTVEISPGYYDREEGHYYSGNVILYFNGFHISLDISDEEASRFDYYINYTPFFREKNNKDSIRTDYYIFISDIDVIERSNGYLVKRINYNQTSLYHTSVTPLSKSKNMKEKLLSELEKYQNFMTQIVFKGYLDMIPIPGKNYEVLNTEVTNALYYFGEGEDKGFFDYPKVCSFSEAIDFCNKLSEFYGLTPVYTKPEEGNIPQRNPEADGFRLPSVEEWIYAAKGGQDFEYNGWLSVSKYYRDFGGEFGLFEAGKPSGCRFPNAYGLYDMFGSCMEFTDIMVKMSENSVWAERVLKCDISERYITDNPSYAYREYISESTRDDGKTGMRLFRTIKQK